LSKCKVCGKTIKYKNSFIHHSKYCSQQCKWNDPDWKQLCSENSNITEETLKKRKQTCLEKYGVENISFVDEVKQKKSETNKLRRGCEYPMQSAEVRNKSKQSCLEKYGVEHISQDETIKEKKNVKRAIIEYQNLLKYKDYVLPNFTLDEYRKNHLNNQSWICVLCGDIFVQKYLYTTNRIKELATCPRCLKCFPLNAQQSNLERELVDFCKQFYPGLKENDRQLIKPYELDIVIPELKLAIEFNRRLLAFRTSTERIKIII
jgi:hypothetical protein